MMDLIADVSSNWKRGTNDDSFACVLDHVEKAAKAGASIVKLQLFQAEKLYSKERAPAQWTQAKKYEFPLDWLSKVRDHAKKNKIKLWASVFDKDTANQSAPFLSGIKIASGDLTNTDLILNVLPIVKKYNLDFVVSTGAATIDEVYHLHELLKSKGITPYMLHCVSIYPSKAEDYNLECLCSIAKQNLGLSDHTGTVDPMLIGMAIALGCILFEVHFAVDETDSPDMCVSLLPDELAEYRKQMYRAVEILGSAWKHPLSDEAAERKWARRGDDGLRPKEG